jgi:threonine dehydratase
VITRSDVDEAALRIAGRVRRTPVLQVDTLPGRTWFKCEYVQHAGSFKARGAFNRVLTALDSGEASGGIVVASGGNAGIAYAYAAAALSVPATVFVPETAPPVKVATLRALGATVEQRGSEYAVASEAAAAFAARTGAALGHAYDQPAVVAGAGTLGTELVAQLPEPVDTVVVAVGGGGLMAGVAAALHGIARVVAVEPAGCPTLHSALAIGGPVDVPVSGVAADALGARRLGDIAYGVAVRTGVQAILVSDEDILAARRELWARYRIVVEAGAAAALAALTSGAYVPSPEERVAIVLCGANTDPSDLQSASRGAG